jgi:hypothetical protein
MKITKEQLNQMIQEELEAYMSETEDNTDVTLEEEEMDMDMEGGDESNEDLMASLRNLYDVLKGMFDGEMEDAPEEMEDAPEEEMEEASEEEMEEVDENLNEHVVVDRFKKLANIRG